MDDNKRYLCKQCKDNYIDAGYTVSPTYNNIKEPCDICNKQGYEYVINERSKGNGTI